jgi:hypothetical protein
MVQILFPKSNSVETATLFKILNNVSVSTLDHKLNRLSLFHFKWRRSFFDWDMGKKSAGIIRGKSSITKQSGCKMV